MGDYDRLAADDGPVGREDLVPSGAGPESPLKPDLGRFDDWSRGQLISRIKQLEQQLSKANSDAAYDREHLTELRRRDSGGYQGNF